MEYSERIKEKYNNQIDSINKIDDEDTRVHLKLKLMAEILNDFSNVKGQQNWKSNLSVLFNL